MNARESVGCAHATQRREVGREVRAPRRVSAKMVPQRTDGVIFAQQDGVAARVDVEKINVSRGVEEWHRIRRGRRNVVGAREVGKLCRPVEILRVHREVGVIRPISHDALGGATRGVGATQHGRVVDGIFERERVPGKWTSAGIDKLENR